MKTSKQIDKEMVQITAPVPIDIYFRMKFEAEAYGYQDMAKYMRAHFTNYFAETNYGLGSILNDVKQLNKELDSMTGRTDNA